MKLVKTASGKETIKISKSDWESIGKQAGWMKAATFGPGFADYLGSGPWKEKFGKDIETDLIINDIPVIMSTMLSDAHESRVVMVTHNGEHIGTYVPSEGFDVTYTKDIERYAPYKTEIEAKARVILENA